MRLCTFDFNNGSVRFGLSLGVNKTKKKSILSEKILCQSSNIEYINFILFHHCGLWFIFVVNFNDYGI